MMRWLAQLVLCALLAVPSAAEADTSQTQATQDILNTSNDHLDLVREYWPRISLGDAQAMTVSYDALNNCGHFKDEIAKAETVDDLDELLSARHPEDRKFAKGIYFKCRNLVHHYDEFPGWRDLRLRAALAGDIRSKVFVTLDFYRFRNERPRESFAFSPARFLIDVMEARDPMVFNVIGVLGIQYGMRRDTSITTSVAWQLIACELHGNCGDASSMSVFCAFMAPECMQWSNAYDFLRHRAGGDEAYAEAERKAEDIFRKVREQRYEELHLNMFW